MPTAEPASYHTMLLREPYVHPLDKARRPRARRNGDRGGWRGEDRGGRKRQLRPRQTRGEICMKWLAQSMAHARLVIVLLGLCASLLVGLLVAFHDNLNLGATA